MKFSDTIGLTSLANKIANNINEGRIAHAQMFVGEDGSEALALARAYVSYILCSDKTDNDSCGKCPACLKMEKLSHPDVHWIFPAAGFGDASGKQGQDQLIAQYQQSWREAMLHHPYLLYQQWLSLSGEEKKKLDIGKVMAEYLFGKMSLKSYEGGMKIAVIWRPELMNAKAANTLLKIIEEPPAKSLFILVSTNVDDVLGTISSRTQITRIPKADNEKFAAWMSEKLQINPQSADTIAFAADGNIGKGLAMAREIGGENEIFVLFRAWMRLCFSRDLAGLKQWINDNSKLSRDLLSGLLQYGLQIVYSSLNVVVRQQEPKLINPAEKEFIKKFAPFVDSERASAYYALFNEAIGDIKWNGNAKIILSDLSFKFMMLLHQKKD